MARYRNTDSLAFSTPAMNPVSVSAIPYAFLLLFIGIPSLFSEEIPPKIEQLNDDRFQPGGITFHTEDRLISFPATVNMNRGAVELTLDLGDGRVHESILATKINPPNGRLAIVADGNSPDPDDIGATAVIFGILNAAGQNDGLVHLSHSCDLKPFKSKGNQSIDAANEQRRQEVLHQLCEDGISHFGPFPNLKAHFNCRADQAGAVNDLRDAINASSANDPLWIIEAGEPDIIGYALEAATASKRPFVHVVSHHPANDNSGDFYTWKQILAFGVREHQIGDQNVELKTGMEFWDWAKNHPNKAIKWIYGRLQYAEQDGVVRFQTNHFDCSDAGMVYWWITGADMGGNQKPTPADMKKMLVRASR